MKLPWWSNGWDSVSSTAWGTGSITGQGTRILLATWYKQKKTKQKIHTYTLETGPSKHTRRYSTNGAKLDVWNSLAFSGRQLGVGQVSEPSKMCLCSSPGLSWPHCCISPIIISNFHLLTLLLSKCQTIALICYPGGTVPMQEMQETGVRSLSREDPLEEEMATHSNILA